MAKITDKERLFIDAYVGEARGNSRRAARLAGYADSSGPSIASKPKIRAEIDRILEEFREDGITTRRGRIEELRDLYARARGIVEARSEHFIARNREIDELEGSDDPAQRAKAVMHVRPAPGAESGFLVEMPRVVGQGRGQRLVWEWQFDKALYSSMEHTLEQVAREVGEWNEKRELTGKDGGPIELTTITDARQALAMAIAQELESEFPPESDSETQR